MVNWYEFTLSMMCCYIFIYMNVQCLIWNHSYITSLINCCIQLTHIHNVTKYPNSVCQICWQ